MAADYCCMRANQALNNTSDILSYPRVPKARRTTFVNSPSGAQSKWVARTFVCCLLWQATARAEPALTIYNQNFAVVRDTVPLNLKAGENQVRFAGATAYLEPSSVVLRDPTGKHRFQVLEQNYRGDPVSQQMLLELNEGKTINFEATHYEAGQIKRELVSGKIIRSGGYDPRVQSYMGYGGGGLQPIIEVNGALRFDLPGQPLFPALGDNSVLKPTLQWVIESEQDAKFEAELGYVTGEMMWEADYNLVLPVRGNTLDLVGWVTMDNRSGKSFENAHIKLMAGDVSKIQPHRTGAYGRFGGGGIGGGDGAKPKVTEKSFDEYHLYTLERPTALLDAEKKQVEFARAAGVRSSAIYVYDGASADQDQVWACDSVHTEAEYGTQCNKKIWIFRELTNSAANHLGMPLPKGRVRIYRRDSDNQLEFTGENTIKHTPRDEVIRLFTGDAFDVVGERKQTNFRIHLASGPDAIDPTTGLPVPMPSSGPPWIDESLEIKLRNHKPEAVEVRVVEHLYRWSNWELTHKSSAYKKTDAQTVEFPVRIEPDTERTVTYTVHYTW